MDKDGFEQKQRPLNAPRQSSSLGKQVAAILLVLVVAAGSFYGGVAYQKGHQTSTNAKSASALTGNGMMGPGGMGGFGTVSAISSSSITVKDTRSGTSTSYSITSSTQVTDNGSSSTVSAIQTGDTVMVQTSSSSSTTAATIVLNPSMGSGPGGPPSSSSSTTTQST